MLSAMLKTGLSDYEIGRKIRAPRLKKKLGRPHSALGGRTPEEFAMVTGGRSPAEPARAAQEEHEEPLTDPNGAIFQ